MARLKDTYKDEIAPKMMEEFGYSSKMQVPRLEKIVVNVGMGAMAHDKDLIEPIRDEIGVITGQRPAIRKARQAVSNFKIREDAPVGYKVTLRRERMYEFLDRLINFVIPRIRDFRGLSQKSFDKHGNYSFGIKEQTIFPELEIDKIKLTHGMDVTFVTTARTKKEAASLLGHFGMPFVK